MTIVDKIETYLNRFMAFPDPDQGFACALWVLHTWTFSESFPRTPYSTPYLYINSTGPRSGKTLLIDLLEPIVLNPERTINMTSSVMFRLIEHVRPTLFVDEVDTVFDGSKNSDLQNVINGGYKPSGYVWRNAPGKDGPEPQKFRTFCPKLLAGIRNKHLPETIATRAIHIDLVRAAEVTEEGEIIAADGTTREIHYTFIAEPLAEQLVSEIEAFMADWKVNYSESIPAPIKGMEPRSWEIAMALVQVARQAGVEDRAREVLARLLAPRKEEDPPEVQALRTIKALFDESKEGALHTDVITEALGEGWNGKLLSNRIIRPFQIGSPTTLNIGNRTRKGYYRHQFDRAFAEYL